MTCTSILTIIDHFSTGIHQRQPDVVLPQGWEWVDEDWVAVKIPGETDENGWKYSTTWGGPWSAEQSIMNVLRTRKLIRRRKYTGKKSQSDISSGQPVALANSFAKIALGM